MCDQQSLRSAFELAQSDQSLCELLEYSMTVKLLAEHHLEFLSLKEGCTGLSESTLVKMPHCWKSHVLAHSYKNITHLFRLQIDLTFLRSRFLWKKRCPAFFYIAAKTRKKSTDTKTIVMMIFVVKR